MKSSLTFLLYIQEAFHAPSAWSFVVLVGRPDPPHQFLHFLLGAHKVVACLRGGGMRGESSFAAVVLSAHHRENIKSMFYVAPRVSTRIAD